MGANTPWVRPAGGRSPKQLLVAGHFPLTAGAQKASLDLGEVNAQLDCIVTAVTAGVPGNAITIRVVGDSAPAEGVSIVRVGSAFDIHFESGVSTQEDVVDEINALAGGDKLIEVLPGDEGNEATILVNGRACTDCALYCDAIDGFDTWIRSGFATGLDGDKDRIGLIGDALAAAGSAEVLALDGGGKLLLLHFQDSVSTVADMEALISALSPADFEIMTAGTGANTLEVTTEGGSDVVGDSQMFPCGASEPDATDTHAEQAATALEGGAAEGVPVLVGGAEVESVAHVSEGLYRLTMRDRFPVRLSSQAEIYAPDAAAYEVHVGPYVEASRTIDIRVQDIGTADLVDPDPADLIEIHFQMWFGLMEG